MWQRLAVSCAPVKIEVVELLNMCSCPTQFPMVRIADGKYRVGDKLIIFLRILRNHIMVRVGGGWDTLEHYLDKHDPCRCKAIKCAFGNSVFSQLAHKTN